jgi:hypothetical protein
MTDEDYGRQPQPVTVRIEGEPEDVSYWITVLATRGEFKGDAVVRRYKDKCFTIYPRARNE